jgi:hypothetical protein
VSYNIKGSYELDKNKALFKSNNYTENNSNEGLQFLEIDASGVWWYEDLRFQEI